MEGWLSKIGCEGRIRKPSCGSLIVFSRRIRFHLLLCRLRSLLNIFFIDSNLPMMIFFLCCSHGRWLSSSFLLLSGHECLWTNNNLICGKMITNVRFLLISSSIFLRWPSLSSRLITHSNLWFFHLLSSLSVNKNAILISLFSLPLVGTPLNLLDLFVFEALLEVLLPQFVPNCVILVLGEAIVSEILRIAIVPVENILYTCGFGIFSKSLFAAKLRLKLGVVLLNQVELDNCLIRFEVRKVVRWLWQVVEMLWMSYWAIMRYILHRLRLRLRDSRCLLDTKLVQEVVSDYGLAEGHFFVIVFSID